MPLLKAPGLPLQAWLEVEILACEAWAELGVIPKEDVKVMRENASFDINRILEIEKDTRHDVVAFTRAVSESLGEERSIYVLSLFLL